MISLKISMKHNFILNNLNGVIVGANLTSREMVELDRFKGGNYIFDLKI